MSKKFVRNITNTRIKGAIQEPLNTNVQNDLLSDDEDVAVRNKDEYHLLTDNVKSITSGNDGIKVKVTGKNSRELVAKIVELTTETDEVSITNPETNVFTIDIDFSDYTDKTLFESEIQRLENEIENVEGGEVDLSNYLSKDEYAIYENTLVEGSYMYINGKFVITLLFSLYDDSGNGMTIPIDSELSIFLWGAELILSTKNVTNEMILEVNENISGLEITVSEGDPWYDEFLRVKNDEWLVKNISINILDKYFLSTSLQSLTEITS